MEAVCRYSCVLFQFFPVIGFHYVGGPGFSERPVTEQTNHHRDDENRVLVISWQVAFIEYKPKTRYHEHSFQRK